MRNYKNRNIVNELDLRYIEQQNALKQLCAEYDLIYYLPDYHADKHDVNTVLIYTKCKWYNKNAEKFQS